jgi:hypothetical protein
MAKKRQLKFRDDRKLIFILGVSVVLLAAVFVLMSS